LQKYNKKTYKTIAFFNIFLTAFSKFFKRVAGASPSKSRK
jgi:hypothetical protein